MKNLYLQIPDLVADSQPLVLAVITGSAGSTPQKPGSSALFNTRGLLSGTVGGGVVEGEITRKALETLDTKESGILSFDLEKDLWHEEDAACGGRLNILIDASPADHVMAFKAMDKSMDQRIPGILITAVTGIRKKSVKIKRFWIDQTNKDKVPEGYPGLKSSVEDILVNGRNSNFSELKTDHSWHETDTLLFLEPVFPQPQLLIAGAGHIGKALAHLANLLDFEVIVIDERAEYANPLNIPDANRIIVDDIGRALHGLKKFGDTYIVIVTRGHKDDAEALKACIDSDVAYIGMIGSRKKTALMREKFINEGWASPQRWDEIYTPIGLEIYSKSVQEIAVSIAAQLVLVRNKKIIHAGAVGHSTGSR